MDTVTTLCIVAFAATLILISFRIAPSRAEYNMRSEQSEAQQERYLRRKVKSKILGFVGVAMLVILGVIFIIG